MHPSPSLYRDLSSGSRRNCGGSNGSKGKGSTNYKSKDRVFSGESGTYVHVSVYVCGGRYQCVRWYQDCTLMRSSYAVQIILASGHSHLQYESCTSTVVGTACSQGYKYWVSVMKSTPVFRHWLGLEALIVKAIRAWKKIMWNSPIQRFCNCRPKIIQ